MTKLLPVFLLVAACASSPQRATERSRKENAAVLVVLDDDVKWGIELIDHREQILPDGRLKAQIRFVNRSSRDRHVQISWTFKDDRQFAVEPPTPFAHYLISAGQTVDLTQESIAAGASDFVVQMKSAKEKGT